MEWTAFLDVMIEDERAAVNKYRIAMEAAQEPELKAVLAKLMHEEEFHIDFLEQEIRRLSL